jgi:hypothetical protein
MTEIQSLIDAAHAVLDLWTNHYLRVYEGTDIQHSLHVDPQFQALDEALLPFERTAKT